jgi:outer membrane receptor for ferrienterochelin and colicin
MSFMKKLSYSAATLALLAAAPAAVHAQVTSAQLRGTVVDETGAPVAGASVTIMHLPSGTAGSATTTSTGSFFESGLRVGGPYRIYVSAPGFEGDVIEDLMIQPGSQAPLTIRLSSATEDVITVTGQAINTLDLNNGVGSTYSARDVSNAPSLNRDLIDTLRLDPLVSQSGESFMSIAGQSPRFNAVSIDGSLQQDNFGLGSNAYATSRSPINIDIVESASVVAADYTVTSGNFQGGLINVVTRSGTNEFDGAAFYYRADEDFRGNVTDGQLVSQTPFTEEEYGISVSGPIIEDKLFFLVSYDEYESANSDFYGTSDANNGIDPAFWTTLADMVQNTYGYDIGTRPIQNATPSTSERLLAKIDWNINADHRASFTYQSTEESDVSTGSTSYDSAYYDVPLEVEAMTFQLFSDWSENLSTTFRISNTEFVRGQNCNAGGDQPELAFEDWTPADLAGTPLDGLVSAGGQIPDLVAGCDAYRHANEYDDSRLIVFGQADYAWNDHIFTVGGEYEQFDLYNLFVYSSNGAFTFYSPQDLLNQQASVVYRNVSTNNVEDGAAGWGYDRFTAFAEDTWQLRDDFSLNFGIRYETFMQDDEPYNDPTISALYGRDTTANLDGKDIIMPRVGFRWDAFDRTTVTGGFGLFSGGAPQVWISNAFQAPVVYASTFGTQTSLDVPQSLIDYVGANAPSVIDIIDPSFEIPADWRASLRVDQEFDINLGGLNLGNDYLFTAQYLYSKSENAFAWQNLAQLELGYALGVAPDGRTIYPDLQDLGEANLTMLTNVDGGESHVFSVALSKEFENGLGFNVSYAYQDVQSALQDTSSRGISSWRTQTTFDRNNVSPAIGSYQVEDRFVTAFWYEHDFFGDLTTRLDLIGEFTSGTPFSYTFNVSSSNALFGRAGQFESPYDSDLLYVPETTDASVVYASSFDLDGFNEIIDSRGIARGQIFEENSETSPWSQQWDLRIQQELPFFNQSMEQFVGDNRLNLVVDIFNVANLLNDEWGTEYNSVSYGQAGVVTADVVSAADVAMNGVDGATALRGDDPRTTCLSAGDCVYRYNYLNSYADGSVNQNLGRSVYSIRVGLRYEF